MSYIARKQAFLIALFLFFGFVPVYAIGSQQVIAGEQLMNNQSSSESLKDFNDNNIETDDLEALPESEPNNATLKGLNRLFDSFSEIRIMPPSSYKPNLSANPPPPASSNTVIPSIPESCDTFSRSSANVGPISSALTNQPVPQQPLPPTAAVSRTFPRPSSPIVPKAPSYANFPRFRINQHSPPVARVPAPQLLKTEVPNNTSASRALMPVSPGNPLPAGEQRQVPSDTHIVFSEELRNRRRNDEVPISLLPFLSNSYWGWMVLGLLCIFEFQLEVNSPSSDEGLPIKNLKCEKAVTRRYVMKLSTRDPLRILRIIH